jgi:predicted CopG family antitoxin
MPNYKTVRVKEKVYNRLAQHMLPRESFSETIERLLDTLSEVAGITRVLAEIVLATVEKKKEG